MKSCTINQEDNPMGFEEVSHTADWSVRVWAQDLPALFAESARAMNALAGTVTSPGPRVKRTFESEDHDVESLLVAFLSELVFYQEQENLAFDTFDIWMSDQKISVTMEGTQITSVDKAIKAVTYHNLKVEETARGVEVVIVFDV
jgi:SHS2 domain-containing protein